jgi:hypothetical protein
MGFKIGIVAIRSAIASENVISTLFYSNTPTAISNSIDQIFSLGISEAAVYKGQDCFVLFSQLLASNIVSRSPKAPLSSAERRLLNLSKNAAIVVSYMQSTTNTCGHQIYIDGKRKRWHYQDQETHYLNGEADSCPSWYIACPTEYTEDYTLQLIDSFLGRPLIDLLGPTPALQMYHVR